jgi:uncharacterized membrane protein YfcA
VLLGFVVGAFGTIVGSGGGFILTPILLLLYPHDSARTLTAISLTAVFFNAASGSAAYAYQRRIDYRSGLAFAGAALPGSVAGALAVGAVSRSFFDVLMGVVLLALAAWLLLGEPVRARAPAGHLVQRALTDRYGQLFEYGYPCVAASRTASSSGSHPASSASAAGSSTFRSWCARSASRRIWRPRRPTSSSRSSPGAER